MNKASTTTYHISQRYDITDFFNIISWSQLNTNHIELFFVLVDSGNIFPPEMLYEKCARRVVGGIGGGQSEKRLVFLSLT